MRSTVVSFTTNLDVVPRHGSGNSPQRHRGHRANFPFFPDRETTIGQKNGALRAPHLHLKTISANHSRTEVPLAEGDGIFPWPSSPRQGNNTILCGLRVCGEQKEYQQSLAPHWHCSELSEKAFYSIVHSSYNDTCPPRDIYHGNLKRMDPHFSPLQMSSSNGN